MLNLETIDCKTVVERELGAAPRRYAKGLIYRCPFHRGKKYSFTVDAKGWKCWADCDAGGDAVSFIMRLKGVDFRAACSYLDVDQPRRPSQPRHRPAPPPEPPISTAEPPHLDWQAHAIEVCNLAHERLMTAWVKETGSHTTMKALDYLVDRGMVGRLFDRFQLGILLPSDGIIDWRKIGAQAAITLPAFDNEHLWNVRLRLLGSEQRYWSLQGGKLKGALFGAHELCGKDLIIDEGEFNALAVNVLYGGCATIQAVAFGSAMNRLDPHYISRLLLCRNIYARFDNDQAGLACLAHLQRLCPSVQPLQVPGYKDMNDFYSDKPYEFAQWLGSLNG